MPLQKLINEQGYLKAGFLGFAKSGKTYTAAKLAIGTIKLFKLTGPVALFDTESGSNYIAEMVKAETGRDLMGVRARSFDALMQFSRDCTNEKVSVAIIDSITHPWVELCDSYLAQLNQSRKEKNWAPLQKLEFVHWSSIKKIWEQWPNFFLNSPMHIILCGRAGFEWEMSTNQETGRKELEKTGVKMKTEKELGFEPSLLVEMDREQVPDGQGGFKMVHTATVLGDRFNVIDGATATNPGFEFFKPHVEKLRPGSHVTVDIASKSTTGADEQGQGDFERERKLRTIYCEEIQGLIVTKFPGQGADDKKAKAQVLQDFFGTRSWTKVESMDSVTLKGCLDQMREMFEPERVSQTETEEEDDVPMDGTEGQDRESYSDTQDRKSYKPSTIASGASKSGEVKSGVPDQKAAQNESGAAEIASLRLLMKAGKIVESRILGMMAELGTIPKGVTTLEGVDRESRARIIEHWGEFSKAYKESQK